MGGGQGAGIKDGKRDGDKGRWARDSDWGKGLWAGARGLGQGSES